MNTPEDRAEEPARSPVIQRVLASQMLQQYIDSATLGSMTTSTSSDVSAAAPTSGSGAAAGAGIMASGSGVA
jgi:hypothetical protein